jgi:glucokinase
MVPRTARNRKANPSDRQDGGGAEHPQYLLADIGGTNTRIALAGKEGAPQILCRIPNDQIEDIRVELSKAARVRGRRGLQFGVIAAAGPVGGGRVRLTNRDWTLSRRELEQALALEQLIIVNDFVAMAHAVTALAPHDLVRLGGGEPAEGNVLVCGPGTGFGTAALMRDAERTFTHATEAGHMRLGATTDEEARVFRDIAGNGGTLSVEQVLSGGGLIALHRCLSGQQARSSQVIAAAIGGNREALKTIDFFMRVFGRVVGDLCLAFNATAAYLVGGVGRALAPLYPASPFRGTFEDHPPYRPRLRATPVFVVTHEAPGLVGAMQIARREFAGSPPTSRRSVL